MTELDQIYEVHKNLYIGAYWPRLNFRKLKEIGITAIVNLMEESYYDPSYLGFSYLHKGFPDDYYTPHKYFDEILEFIEKNLKANGKVLVHCSMGVSRSGGIVILWLLKNNHDWNWKDALAYVRESKFIAPAIEIRESILDYLEKIDNYRRKS
ncbi:MAG: dual specificity protein phosphatase family protein [Promethearchaeota archaeon]